jgi:hypothetical protein
MPSGGSRRPNTPKREADLSSLLTGSEKNELALLVTKITDTMQKQISHGFDSVAAGDLAEKGPPSFWNKLPEKLKDLSLTHHGKENQKPNTDTSDSKAATEVLDKAEQEALGPRLQELKKEALQFFRRWQTSVHRRLGDISVKSPGGAQKGQSSSSSGKRGPTTSTTSGTTCE